MNSLPGSPAVGADYYRHNYPDYDRQNSPRKLDFYLGLLRQWARRGQVVHELGVGLGYFLARASKEYVCSGSDVNAYGVSEARRRAPGATVYEGSVDAIPRQPPPDVVVAWDVLEHIPELRPALRQIGTRLAPGGVLIAVVPVYDGPLGWLVNLLDTDPTHVTKWSRAEWMTVLEENGFQVVASGGIIRRLVAGRVYVHLTRPRVLMRAIGSALWFVARKR